MVWQAEVKNAVRSAFNREKQRSPTLSLRSFAKIIDTPVSTVSELMNGKILLAPKRAAEVVKNLTLEQRETKRILALLDQPVEFARESLEGDKFALLTDWRYSAVLFYHELDTDQLSAGWIAKRLRIAETRVAEIIGELTEQGFLVRNETGKLVTTGKHFRAGDGAPSEVIRSYHAQNLACAVEAIERVPAKERDFSSSTFAGNARQMELIRTEIRRLHEKVVALSEGESPRDRLYKLNVSFFPLDDSEEIYS